MVPNHQPAILLVLCWSQLTVTGAYRGTWAEGARSESFPQLLGCWSTLGGQVRTKRDGFLHGFFDLRSEKMDGFPHVFQASSFSIFSISLFGGCVNWKTHIAFFGFSRTWNLPAPCPKIKPLNYLTKVCKQPEVFQHVQASFFHNSRINPPFFNHRQRTIPKRWESAGYFPHPPPGLSASCDIPEMGPIGPVTFDGIMADHGTKVGKGKFLVKNPLPILYHLGIG